MAKLEAIDDRFFPRGQQFSEAVTSLRQLKAGDGAGAGAESIGVGAEAVEELDVEIAEGRVLLRVEGEVLAVLEAAAGDEDRHVLVVVAAGVAEVASEHDDGAIQQRAAFIARVLQLREKFAE